MTMMRTPPMTIATTSCWMLLLLLLLGSSHALLNDVFSDSRFRLSTGKAIERSYIVRLKRSGFLKNRTAVIEAATEYLSEYIQQNEAKIENFLSELIAGFTFEIDKSTKQTVVEAVLRRLLNATDVVDYIEQDTELGSFNSVTGSDSGDDIVCPGSWGLDRIDQNTLPLDGVFHFDWNGTGVDAYILDTGVRSTHEQFEGRVSCGPSYIRGESDSCQDFNGHGTHVAGTVGGKDYGVARNVNLIAVKVLNGDGVGSTSRIASAVEWVAERVLQTGRNSVINMSLGGAGRSQSMDDAIEEAGLAGTLTVVAAGNDDSNACAYTPANSQYAVTVASTDIDDVRSSFSNFGDCVDIFAPGRSITSAWSSSDTATNRISGTSMASPHIAGLAAVYWEQNPDYSVLELAQHIRNTSSPDQVTDSQTEWDEMGVTVATFTTQPISNSIVCEYKYSGGDHTQFVSWYCSMTITALLSSVLIFGQGW